jgi:hypothetical protein
MGFKDLQKTIIQKTATGITKWIGSTTSVVLHTILFSVSFLIPYMGYIPFEKMLLILTTIVSIEAIYLSIFIQMSLNMSKENIEIIQENIEEMSDDIEELGEDIEELAEEMSEDDTETVEQDNDKMLKSIRATLFNIQRDIQLIKRK